MDNGQFFSSENLNAKISPLVSSEFPFWDVFVANSVQANPFSLTSFAQAYQQATGIAFQVFVMRENAEIVGGILVYSKKQWGISRVIVPPFVPFMTFFPSGNIEKDTAFWQHFSKKWGALQVALHPQFPQEHFIALETSRSLQERHTFEISPKPLDIFLDEWTSKRRTKFRKAVTGLKFEETQVPYKEMIELVEKSYARHQRKLPLPKEKMLKLVENLPSEMLKFFVACDKNKCIQAGVIVLCDTQTAFYWLAGSLPETEANSHKNAMFALIPHMLDSLYRHGISRFDFVGANTPRINRFKEQFPSVKVAYLVLYSSRSFLLRWQDRIVNTVREMKKPLTK